MEMGGKNERMCQKGNFKGKSIRISKCSHPGVKRTESNSQIKRLCKLQGDPLSKKITLK